MNNAGQGVDEPGDWFSYDIFEQMGIPPMTAYRSAGQSRGGRPG